MAMPSELFIGHFHLLVDRSVVSGFHQAKVPCPSSNLEELEPQCTIFASVCSGSFNIFIDKSCVIGGFCDTRVFPKCVSDPP